MNEHERMTALLEAALLAFNSLRRQKLCQPGVRDTYDLAHEIERYFKDRDEGAFRED